MDTPVDLFTREYDMSLTDDEIDDLYGRLKKVERQLDETTLQAGLIAGAALTYLVVDGLGLSVWFAALFIPFTLLAWWQMNYFD